MPCRDALIRHFFCEAEISERISFSVLSSFLADGDGDDADWRNASLRFMRSIIAALYMPHGQPILDAPAPPPPLGKKRLSPAKRR